jgi:hypothetical protein
MMSAVSAFESAIDGVFAQISPSKCVTDGRRVVALRRCGAHKNDL